MLSMWSDPSVCHTVTRTSELVSSSLVGKESAKLVEMWKNKHDLGRTERSLVAVE